MVDDAGAPRAGGYFRKNAFAFSAVALRPLPV